MKTRNLRSELDWRRVAAALLIAGVIAFAHPSHTLAQAAPDDASAPANQTLQADRDLRAGDAENPSDDTDADTQDIALEPSLEADAREALDAAALKELQRQNLRQETVDALKPKQPTDNTLTPGIAVGSMTFRPALTETLGYERTRTGKDVTSRAYLQTGFKGSLVSDWALHELKVDTEGTWQKTFSGVPEDDPEGKIEAALKLDVSHATIATLKLGYALAREDVTAANAISNAVTQAQVSTYTASAEVTHDFGLIRGTVGLDVSRDTYGDAELVRGTLVSQKDRNANTATLRSRIGYELSPALIPFVEASVGKTIYDSHRDSLGYIRDAQLYAVKTGIAADFGEKLRGELSTGYSMADFEDSRLSTLSALTFDGNATWSPRRGTDVVFGLATEIEPSTTAGASGSVAYTANMALTQAIIDQLSGTLSASNTWRHYSLSSTQNQNVVNLGGGLTWGLSRSLDLVANTSWEHTTQKGSPRSDVLTTLVGITLKR